jgi:hypothetical protein
MPNHPKGRGSRVGWGVRGFLPSPSQFTLHHSSADRPTHCSCRLSPAIHSQPNKDQPGIMCTHPNTSLVGGDDGCAAGEVTGNTSKASHIIPPSHLDVQLPKPALLTALPPPCNHPARHHPSLSSRVSSSMHSAPIPPCSHKSTWDHPGTQPRNPTPGGR